MLLERSLKAAQLAQYRELVGGIEGEIEKQKAASRATGNEVAKLNETIPLMIDRLTAKQGLLQQGPPRMNTGMNRAPPMQVLELQQTLIEMQRDRDEAVAAVSHRPSPRDLVAGSTPFFRPRLRRGCRDQVPA